LIQSFKTCICIAKGTAGNNLDVLIIVNTNKTALKIGFQNVYAYGIL